MEGLVPGETTAGTEPEGPTHVRLSGGPDNLPYHAEMLMSIFPPQMYKLLKSKHYACSCPPTVPNQILGLYRVQKNICGMNERGSE